MVRRRAAAPGGYTLVALIVIVAVMNVLVAAALPAWSQVMKRDREAELIFRGLQYAEAIRVFQLRHGRLPVTLDELVEVNPRSIRQLWKDPMTDHGEWGLVFAQASQANQPPGRRGQVAPEAARTRPARPRPDSPLDSGRGPGERRSTGPIIGVHSLSEDQAVRSFLGGGNYNQWLFTVDLIPVAAVQPGTLNVPRPTSEWIGRPFRDDLGPQQGQMPGQGQPPQGTDPRRRSQRPRGG